MFGPSLSFAVSTGIVQVLQLILITNYSIKASGRNLVTSNASRSQSNGEASQHGLLSQNGRTVIRNYSDNHIQVCGDARQDFDDHIEYLLGKY